MAAALSVLLWLRYFSFVCKLNEKKKKKKKKNAGYENGIYSSDFKKCKLFLALWLLGAGCFFKSCFVLCCCLIHVLGGPCLA